MVKTCTSCKQAKPVEEFRQVWEKRGEKTYGPYRDSFCRKCRGAAVLAWRREKTQERQLLGIDGRKRYKPWSKAIRELLADGEWHEWEEIMRTGSVAVPPGVAYRRGFRRVTGDESDRISSGARTLCRQAVWTMIDAGLIERDRHRLRWIGSSPHDA